MLGLTMLFLTLFVWAQTLRTETEYQELFVSFKRDFKRTYSQNEASSRYQIFRKNVDFIDTLNKKHNPDTTFGITTFADMTKSEKRAYRNGFIANHSGTLAQVTSIEIPSSVDWRKKGAVTPISSQGQCGSSPYWSAVVSMEGAWAIAGNPLVQLSTQQIIDCSEGTNMGCNGGYMTTSFEYIIKYGSESAAAYPSDGQQNNCTYDASKVVARFSSYKNVPAGDEKAFAEALTIVPVASAINVEEPFEYYTGGIYTSTTCGTNPDHGIGVVGYGTLNGKDYYILKNTWGVDWGLKGYALLARNQGNMCGIASFASYIIV